MSLERDFYLEALDLAIHGKRFHHGMPILAEPAHCKALYDKLLSLQRMLDDALKRIDAAAFKLGVVLNPDEAIMYTPETGKEAGQFYRGLKG